MKIWIVAYKCWLYQFISYEHKSWKLINRSQSDLFANERISNRRDYELTVGDVGSSLMDQAIDGCYPTFKLRASSTSSKFGYLHLFFLAFAKKEHCVVSLLHLSVLLLNKSDRNWEHLGALGFERS